MIKVLITGCSKGFGLLMVKLLAKQAHLVLPDGEKTPLKIYASARRPAQAQELLELEQEFENVQVLELDLLNSAHIEKAANLFKVEPLDVLINNAGYGLMGKIADLKPELVKEQFATNLFAPIELIRQLLPSFSQHGLVINISSIASYLGLPGFGAYSASKTALNAIGMSLACENNNLAVVSVQPGPYNTQFRQSAVQANKNSEPRSASKLFSTQEDSAEVAELIYALIQKRLNGRLKPYTEIPIGSNTNLLRLASRWLPLNWLVKVMMKN